MSDIVIFALFSLCDYTAAIVDEGLVIYEEKIGHRAFQRCNHKCNVEHMSSRSNQISLRCYFFSIHSICVRTTCCVLPPGDRQFDYHLCIYLDTNNLI